MKRIRKNKIYEGDCLEVLKGFPDNFVDSIVTDPPYELGFMDKAWDKSGIAYKVELWQECYRVLKPGGHLLSFGGSRTYHRMACAIENAGFEIRDMIEWVYGGGFPKSYDIGKAVDKLQGNERENIGKKAWSNPKADNSIQANSYGISGGMNRDKPADRVILDETKGTSDWEGWGSQLKPSHESICMARKKISEKTIAGNCLKWGTGAINIDESKVGYESKKDSNATLRANTKGSGRYNKTDNVNIDLPPANQDYNPNKGRFPANLILSADENGQVSKEVRECFPDTKSGKAEIGTGKGYAENPSGIASTGKIASCFGDSGNASRYFKSIIYQPKAGKKERGASNNHPTVKPVALIEYLIKIITSENGIVLDPFMGSGTTAVACEKSHRNYLGIELNPEYIEIAEKRIDKTHKTLFAI